MLSPEVWDFQAPKHYSEYLARNNKEALVSKSIKNHYFNHSVYVVLPTFNNISEDAFKNIIEDCEYYKICGLKPSLLLNKEFIESFVKKGELSLLTIGKKIDLENSIAITPDGYLILSLTRETYQTLGLEGKPTYFDRKEHSRYVVTIDLKDDNLTPGKKNYKRILRNLSENWEESFNVIFSWDPPDSTICPSSVAAWFNKHNNVFLCRPTIFQNVNQCIDIPVFESTTDLDQFFEWLGFFSIDADLKTNNSLEKEYVNSYSYPSSMVKVERVHCQQFVGFFTRKKIENIFYTIDNLVRSEKNIPWCTLDFQGFMDSPVSYGLKEHSFYIDGDNSYTIVFHSNNEYILRKSLSSNNKPKIVQ